MNGNNMKLALLLLIVILSVFVFLGKDLIKTEKEVIKNDVIEVVK